MIIGNREKLMRQIRSGGTTITKAVPEAVDAKEYIMSRVVVKAYEHSMLPADHVTREVGPVTLQAETMEARFLDEGISVRSEPVSKAVLPEVGIDEEELWETAMENSRGFLVPYYLFTWSSIPTTYFPMSKYWRNGGGVFTITLPFAWNAMAFPFVTDWKNSLPGLPDIIGRFRVGIRDRYVGVYPEGCYAPAGMKLLFEYDPVANGLAYVERR